MKKLIGITVFGLLLTASPNQASAGLNLQLGISLRLFRDGSGHKAAAWTTYYPLEGQCETLLPPAPPEKNGKAQSAPAPSASYDYTGYYYYYYYYSLPNYWYGR